MRFNKLLVRHLLQRGDLIFITGGRLVIKPKSGNCVPDEWLKDHSQFMVQDIVAKTNTDAFVFDSYSTGHYGKAHSGGVTLQFISLLSGDEAYVIFNADLTKQRNTKSGKKGSPLTKGKFRVGKRSLFYKFWEKSGLVFPKRLSSFHDYMGNLKKLFFTGNYEKGEKLNKKSLVPLEISYSDILKAFNLANLPDKTLTGPVQNSDNYHTSIPYSEMPESQIEHGMQPTSSTGIPNCGNRLTGSAGIRGSELPSDTHERMPQDQSNQDWLKDRFPNDFE